LYRLLFHNKNTILVDDLPEEIQCLAPDCDPSSQEEDLLRTLTRLGVEGVDG
jgi:hypothetical protein